MGGGESPVGSGATNGEILVLSSRTDRTSENGDADLAWRRTQLGILAGAL